MSIPWSRSLCAAVLSVLAFHAMADDEPKCQRQTVTGREFEGGTDGAISATNHAAQAAKRFEMMDVNKDGKVTADEINASHGAESIVWANEPVSPAEKIRELDTNGDGVLTVSEYAKGSQKMFNKVDVNGDGYLTASELSVHSKRR